MISFFWFLFGGEFQVLYADGNISTGMRYFVARDYAKIFTGDVYPSFMFEEGWTKDCEYFIHLKQKWCKPDHKWKSDWELSLDGTFAVVAGLWWPPTTCTRCKATKEHQNGQWAEENGWLKGSEGKFAVKGKGTDGQSK